jgi:energy-coupling factor transporter ATP-binding protein EcfA2
VQNFKLTLASPVATSFRATKAANSLDIDSQKKSIHHFEVQADLTTPFNIGLIVGASGSGKTTLAKHIYGNECFKEVLDISQPVIDQFPEAMSYDECAAMLCGVGLTAVPCWIRPAYTLSNGQRARAECALQMARDDIAMIAIDEWTSVVDRTVAKVMSHCIQKHARKTGKKIVLMSCHYDVIEWLNPDWVIDANKQTYENRRSLWRDFKRTEQLQFDIYETSRRTWQFFSKYHYLSEKLAGGKNYFYGLWSGSNQIGFLAFSNYVPHRKGTTMQLHFNRLVIHPDYCGFGLGIHFLNKCAKLIADKDYEVMGKFSSAPVYNALKRDKHWRLNAVQRKTPMAGALMDRKSGFRQDVKTWSFKYVA